MSGPASGCCMVLARSIVGGCFGISCPRLVDLCGTLDIVVGQETPKGEAMPTAKRRPKHQIIEEPLRMKVPKRTYQPIRFDSD